MVFNFIWSMVIHISPPSRAEGKREGVADHVDDYRHP
jgi:hypothetical protein